MTKNQIEWVMFVTLILVILAALTAADQRDSLKAEAVKRGFAEWHILGQDSTEFRWKETK